MSETEEVKQEKKGGAGRSKTFIRTYQVSLIGILSAIACVLMILEFPVLFIAPDFYKFDFSDFPAIIGAFALGPIPGVIIEGLKNILKIIVKGTNSGFIGEAANFTMGVFFVLPASLIYFFKKTKKRAVIGLVISTAVCVVIGSLLNAFILLPAYSKFYGAPIEVFIAEGTKVHAIITDLPTFVMFAVAPFNLLKYTVITVLTILIYKSLSRVLKNPMERA